MKHTFANKRKIINDPVYGFINIPGNLIFEIIEHPFFQRLRRIKQLGLTHLIYPGALHTRFHHSIGAMHLMCEAIDTLRAKGQEITKEEEEAVCIAILLHDIGHGPFSHSLEHSIVSGINHEMISGHYMEALNGIFAGKLSMAIDIFRNKHDKKFLHQLIAGQLDMDRLDYLKRDSFFTGVSEGVINAERIIKMLDVVDDELVVEAKGIYSVEKFVIARRLMYWQVYLHKTVIAAEYILRKILTRANYLVKNGETLFATPALEYFLRNAITDADFRENSDTLNYFSKLDDFDIFTSIKVWADHSDKTLSLLSSFLVNRNLFKIEMQQHPFKSSYVSNIRKKALELYDIPEEDANYFIFTDRTSNYTFDPEAGSIKILHKNGKIADITEASDQLNISVLSRAIIKHFLCYPKPVYYDMPGSK